MQKVEATFQQLNATLFSLAQQQIQASQPQQIQQLNEVLLQTFQMIFQGGSAREYKQILGKSFPNMPPPGYVQEPGPSIQFPKNPVSPPGVAPQPGDGKSGLIQTGKNPPKFVTPGGYTIEAEGKNNAWKITTPEGKTTRIYNDPQVKESDGGRWDFKKGMSFVLPDGTKITCKTTPPTAHGHTVTQSIDIMHGNERATIGGIDKNKPVSEGVKQDRWQVDGRTPDGDYAVLGGDGDDWFLHGKNEIVGSSRQGKVLHTRQGKAAGITQKAREAMQEMPPFGSQPFMQQMMQQLLKALLSPRPFGPFGGQMPFQAEDLGGPTRGPQPGMGGWGGPGHGWLSPRAGQQFCFCMEKIGLSFDLLRRLTEGIQALAKKMQEQQSKQPATENNKVQGDHRIYKAPWVSAKEKYTNILESFYEDEAANLGGMERLAKDSADFKIRELANNPEELRSLNTRQKLRLLDILKKQTPHLGFAPHVERVDPGALGEWRKNGEAALNILRSAKDSAEFKQMVKALGLETRESASSWDNPFGHLFGRGEFQALHQKFDLLNWIPPWSPLANTLPLTNLPPGKEPKKPLMVL